MANRTPLAKGGEIRPDPLQRDGALLYAALRHSPSEQDATSRSAFNALIG